MYLWVYVVIYCQQTLALDFQNPPVMRLKVFQLPTKAFSGDGSKFKQKLMGTKITVFLDFY